MFVMRRVILLFFMASLACAHADNPDVASTSLPAHSDAPASVAAVVESSMGVAHEPMDNVLEVTLGLLVVLILIFVVAWLVKRYGSFHSTAGGNLRVVGGLSLGQKERVMLVQVGEKQILLGVSPGRVAMLHVLEEPLSIELSSSGPESFSDKLQSALNQRLKK